MSHKSDAMTSIPCTHYVRRAKVYYYKSARDEDNGKDAAGAIECADSIIERQDELTFAVHTSERVLTLRAETESELWKWLGQARASNM